VAYTFDNLFAADPSNPTNVASNASILLYDPADPTKAPVTITDPTGSPIPNPVTVNKNGFGPAMQHATLDRLAWEGGGFSNFITSYEGIKNEAVSARTAAQTAAANASAAAADSLALAVSKAEAAQVAATNAAQDATNAAALVGSPADTAIAAAIKGDTATKAALSDAIATSSGGLGLSGITAGIVNTTFKSGYGVTAAGVPYFDTDGASIGEEALLTPDPSSTSGLSLVKIGG
jgi:hypothetical protein